VEWTRDVCGDGSRQVGASAIEAWVMPVLNLVIPTGAYPDFLSRCSTQSHLCAFP
jgi:hypothetical protein